MRIVPFLLAFSFILQSCGDFKTKALGDDEEILVIADDDTWGTLEPILKEVLQDTVWTPIPEPWYILRRVTFDEWGQYENHMNRIVVAPLTGTGPVAGLMRNSLDQAVQQLVNDGREFMFNKYDSRARGQILMFLTAPDLVTLEAAIENQRSEILYSFEQMSLRREHAALAAERSYQKKDIERSLLQNYGWTMTVQHDYHVAVDSAAGRFFWVRRANPPDLERWIFVHWRPVFNPAILTEAFALTWRDSITKAYLRTIDDDAYVQIAPYHLRIETVNFLGRFAYETRGNWRFSDKTGGGPFVNYTFYDDAERRLYIVDGSVFAPRVAKRDLILQVDALLRTFKVAGDLAQEERDHLGGYKSMRSRERDKVDENLDILFAVGRDQINFALLPPLKRLQSVRSFPDLQRSPGNGIKRQPMPQTCLDVPQ